MDAKNLKNRTNKNPHQPEEETGLKLLMDSQVQGMKLGAVADKLKVFTAIQMDLDRLEQQAGWNLVKFNKEKCKVLQVGRANPTQQRWSGWRAKLSKWHEGALAARLQRMLTEPWGHQEHCCHQAEEVTLPFYSVLVRSHVKNSVQFWTPQWEKWNYWRESSEEPVRGLRAWTIKPAKML